MATITTDYTPKRFWRPIAIQLIGTHVMSGVFEADTYYPVIGDKIIDGQMWLFMIAEDGAIHAIIENYIPFDDPSYIIFKMDDAVTRDSDGANPILQTHENT
jgi:hypothetical protein